MPLIHHYIFLFYFLPDDFYIYIYYDIMLYYNIFPYNTRMTSYCINNFDILEHTIILCWRNGIKTLYDRRE